MLHEDFVANRDGDSVDVVTGTRSRYDVRLDAGHRISVRVLDVEGAPLADVDVRGLPTDTARLRGLGRMMQAIDHQMDGQTLAASGLGRTDEKGEFELRSLEPRIHDLRFEKAGFAWRDLRDVPPGIDGLVVTMNAAATVTGRVISPDSEPVAGATVVLQQPRKSFRNGSAKARRAISCRLAFSILPRARPD